MANSWLELTVSSRNPVLDWPKLFKQHSYLILDDNKFIPYIYIYTYLQKGIIYNLQILCFLWSKLHCELQNQRLSASSVLVGIIAYLDN